MTQNPYDQLSKQLLAELLEPLGTVKRSLEVPGEAKFVDLWFEPQSAPGQGLNAIGVLETMAQNPCLMEPYRNPPNRSEVHTCLLKLRWVQDDLRRQAERDAANTPTTEPFLWIIATAVSKPILTAFGAKPDTVWGDGFHFCPEGIGLAFVAINQLPESPATLILRLLGRGKTQQQAVEDVLALPNTDPLRSQIIRILGNWKVTLELEQPEFEDRESIMAFSPAFLEWEQATQQRSREEGLAQGLQHERSLILRQLERKVGTLPAAVTSQIQNFSAEQLEGLGLALLDFNRPEDVQQWLANLN